MVVSFGIEFEFDSLDGRTLEYVSLGQNGVSFKNGFTYQADGTAGTEARTPVCVDVADAAKKISELFADSESRYSPILKGIGPIHNSLGQHIHIGQPSTMLARNIKRRIALHARKVYPFLVAIHANSMSNGNKSNRGMRSSFCRFLSESEIMDNSHYGEISNSYIGTVEFRKFDANIPQATLVCATILKVVAQGALNGKVARDPFNDFNYNQAMRSACINGFNGMDVQAYLTHIFTRYAAEWNQLMETEGIPDCVWEVLFLASKKVSVGDIAEQYVYGNPQAEFDYFKSLASHASSYFTNLPLNIVSILSERELVGVYEPTIPTVRAVEPRVPRTVAAAVFTREALEAAVRSGLEAGQMDAPARYFYIVQQLKQNVSTWEIQRTISRFVSYAEFEVQTTRRLIRMRVEDRTAAINDLRISDALRNKLIQLFVVLAIDSPSVPQVAVTSTPQPVRSTHQVNNAVVNDTTVARLGELSVSARVMAAERMNISVDEMLNLPQRVYVGIRNGTIEAVVSAHVRCQCSPGLVTTHFQATPVAVAAVREVVERELASAGRAIAITV